MWDWVMGEWSGVDTPQTVMTARAPAVLKINSSSLASNSIHSQVKDTAVASILALWVGKLRLPIFWGQISCQSNHNSANSPEPGNSHEYTSEEFLNETGTSTKNT